MSNTTTTTTERFATEFTQIQAGQIIDYFTAKNSNLRTFRVLKIESTGTSKAGVPYLVAEVEDLSEGENGEVKFRSLHLQSIKLA